MSKPSLKSLTESFRKLGIKEPEDWATSQIEDGFNHLAAARFLQLIYGELQTIEDTNWIVRDLPEASTQTTGEPNVSILKQMIDAGISMKGINYFVRNMQLGFLLRVCSVLDGICLDTERSELNDFGVFALDNNGKPTDPLYGLHECFCDFTGETFE